MAWGSGVRNKTNDKTTNPYSQYPADPRHQDGFYWVTGPEGLVTNEDSTTGTKFWDTSKSYWNKDLKKSNYGEQVYGYTKWSSWSGGGQPDNSSPFLTVGYGNNNAWDDAAIDGGTTVGFVQETNLYNSSLNIKTDGGKVTLQGDLGKSVGLDTVKIDAGSGSVTTGNTQNTATKYNNGTIYADHGVYINGGEVTVGGEIHSGGTDVEATRNTDSSFSDYLDNVTINSAGNLTVHGIEVNASTDPNGKTSSRTDGEGGKIKLTSTGTKGTITLGDGVDYNGKNTNGGVLKAASTANDAVVIDAQGEKSKFVNETTSTKAIDTQGRWKIYSASPEQNTFGKNLNSETDAQWTSYSTKFAANGSDENKFIFQTTPTITLYVEDQVKTYGDDVTKQLPGYMMNREEFTGVDGTLHNVKKFTDAFQEKEYTNYISVPENQSIIVTSVGKDGADGAVGTATRTGGKYTAIEKSGSDGNNAVYDLNVNLNGATAKDGYVLKSENATLEILKRTASITGTGTQTYGDTDGTIKNWTDTQTNIANGSKVSYTTSIKSGSAYTNNQKDRNTADHGTYKDSVSFDNLKIIDAEGHDVDIAANYDLTTTGTIDVAKAKLNINIDDTSATYGSSEWTPYTYKLDKLVNGDTSASITVGDWQNGGIRTDSTDKDVKTQGVGGLYPLTGKFELTGDTAKNYEIGTVNPGKAIVNPKDIYIYAEGNGSTLGDVTWTKITRDDLVNGDSWDKGLFAFRVEPGDLISYADKIFGIKGYVNGQLVSDGTQLGNYIYHPAGRVQLTFNPIVKPDVWAHSGGYRPRNKIETSLPVFRVEDAKVGQYGTYGVEHNEEGDKLVLSATGMRLPEPDQVPDEERTFTTTLSTETGSGTFQLVYNGVSLKVYPQDKEAEETVRAGDKTKNVSLSEKALYVGYTEMGLDLIDLKGVYIYFN